MIVVFSSDEKFSSLFYALDKSEFKVGLLVSEPPKPKGRGLAIGKNPAHLFAAKYSLLTLTPEKLDRTFESHLKKFIQKNNIKLGFVFSFGKIIPKNIIELFPAGILNLHPSLLPKYRGPTPIKTAILNQDKETGYSIIKINEKIDGGPIVACEKIKIKPNDNFETLKEKIIKRASKNLAKTFKMYLSGKMPPKIQNKTQASYTKKLEKPDGQITSQDNAKSALAKILAFSSWPKAYFKIAGQKIIIHRAHLEAKSLIIDEIQMENRQKIKFSDFKNGYPNLLTKFPHFVKI
jgi:methionyl-tRNA formyltransferase